MRKIAIAGGGTTGFFLAQKLSLEGFEVVVIEQDRDRAEKVAAEIDVVVVRGSATNLQVLREAEIYGSYAAVATLPKDADNLAFVILAKSLGIERIFAVMRDPQYEEGYKLAGADNVYFLGELLIGKVIASLLPFMSFRKLFSFKEGKIEVALYYLPETSKLVGKTIAELNRMKGFPTNVLVAAQLSRKEEKYVSCKGETQLIGDADLMLVGSEDDIMKALIFFRRYE
jgi:trk system potassium uptake protein TrkA